MMASFCAGGFGRFFGLGRRGDGGEGGVGEGRGIAELELRGADGLEVAETAPSALVGALQGVAKAGEPFELVELRPGGVPGTVEAGLEEVGASKLPGGVEELLEGVGFERAEGQDFGAEGGLEVVEVLLLRGQDDEAAGGEAVGDGVHRRGLFALFGPGSGGFARVGAVGVKLFLRDRHGGLLSATIRARGRVSSEGGTRNLLNS
jgi:hypothetical protein